MSKYEIKNAQGEKVAETDLVDGVFGIEPNIHVMHHIVKCQMSNWRQGTHSTKGRSDVSGGGKKPWRQKGTGRARQGSIRAPHWTGGGVVFGPHPRSYAFRVNRKEVKLAMRSVLSGKLADNELIVVEDFAFEKPRTKDAVAFLKAMGCEDVRTTVVIADDDVNGFLSFRNIKKVNVLPASESNTYELIDNKKLILTKSAVNYLEEVLA